MAEDHAARDVRAADLALVSRCIAGDQDAHRELFRSQRRNVHAVIYRIMGSNSNIDDLIQESFLQVFRSLHSFRGESKLSTWIGRITTRAVFAFIRRRKKRREVFQPEVAVEPTALSSGNNSSMNNRLDAKRALQSLYAILELLDPKHRIAYALFVVDGRTLAEVAELTDSTVAATKTRVFRARKEVTKRAQRQPLLAAYLATSLSTANDGVG